MIVGILAVIFAVRPWVIIPTLFLGIIFLWLRRFYMHSSRDIKRMEGIAKSPVFSHFSNSLQGRVTTENLLLNKHLQTLYTTGLTTIRSFSAEPLLRSEFYYQQVTNENTVSQY